MKLVLTLAFILVHSLAQAQGVAVVQSAAPTSDGGTQDFTSSGFGTPICALFFGGYGTANGTVVNHAGLSVGFSDFTNHQAVTRAAEDTGGTSDTGSSAVGTAALQSLLTTDQTVDGTATASTITDGARLTWSDAPPSAYLNAAVLFNTNAISNCAVGSVAASTTIGATASAAGLGFQPDLILAIMASGSGNARTAIGMALNDGGIVQYAVGQDSNNGVGTTAVIGVVRNDRITLNASGDAGVSLELTSFDAGGFTVTTRGSTAGSTMRYMALKLATGVSAKLLTCTSPTSTGSHSCTGSGFTPQAGIMLHSIVDTLNVYDATAVNSEAFGVSAFTSAASYTSTVADDDGSSTSNTESMTDSKPVRLRKDAADFMTATLTGFQADGADFNYTTTNGTARYRVVLFLEATATAVFGPLRRRGF